MLASGAILLDGQTADWELLGTALEKVKLAGGQVWYYRESAGAAPPPAALAVIQRVVQLKIPISLSSKADFSDWVDGKGASHPRTADSAASGVPGPRIPEVSSRSDIEEVFERLRKSAADGIAILKPDRTHLMMTRLGATPALEGMAKSVDRLIPGAVKRNIAVIGDTVFETVEGKTLGLTEVSKSIPFLGILVGLSYIGHAVWVFEGHMSAMAAGCRGADVLIVDSALRGLLAPGWEAVAAPEMRNANILVHDRGTAKFTAVRRVGMGEQLQFAG